MTGSTVLLLVVPRASATPEAVRAAADRLGLRVVFVADKHAFDAAELARHEAQGTAVCVDLADTDAAAAILRQQHANKISTFSEGMVPSTSRIAVALGLDYHDPDTMLALTDKSEQRRILAAAGIEAVRSIRVTDRRSLKRAVDAAGGDVVVKPARSQSSADTYALTPGQDLPQSLHPTTERPFVVEDRIMGRDCGDFGDYVSVESVVVKGRPRTIGITGKLPLLNPFRETGQFVPVDLSVEECAAITSLADRAATALGIRTGLMHTEIKLSPDGPRVIEVNGRLGGFTSDLYLRGPGVDLLEVGLAATAGLPVNVNPRPMHSVEAQFWTTPPPQGGRLVKAAGVDEVRRIPGILSYESMALAGEYIEAGVGSRMLDFVRATAPSHRELISLRRRVFSQLTFQFEPRRGRVSCWQPDDRGQLAAKTIDAKEL